MKKTGTFVHKTQFFSLEKLNAPQAAGLKLPAKKCTNKKPDLVPPG